MFYIKINNYSEFEQVCNIYINQGIKPHFNYTLKQKHFQLERCDYILIYYDQYAHYNTKNKIFMTKGYTRNQFTNTLNHPVIEANQFIIEELFKKLEEKYKL